VKSVAFLKRRLSARHGVDYRPSFTELPSSREPNSTARADDDGGAP
jgi:hypothetical protein